MCRPAMTTPMGSHGADRSSERRHPLVGRAASSNERSLLTRDRRAERIYRLLGVTYRLVDERRFPRRRTAVGTLVLAHS